KFEQSIFTLILQKANCMEKYVIKRNGIFRPFELFKIEQAIEKAFQSESQIFNPLVVEEVMKQLDTKETWAVEEIQDNIEKVLFSMNYFSVMKSFMVYRHTRKMQREHVLGLNEDTTYVDSTQ